MKEKRSKEYKKGFTLVETLVAVSVLIIAIVAPLEFVSRSVSYGRSANDETTSIYLAQEAIEAIRNERDRFSLTPGAGWDAFLASLGSPSSSCFSSSGCIVDMANQFGAGGPLFIDACVVTCPQMTQNTSTKLYSYGSGASWKTTPFTRTIKIISQTTNEIKISATVSWSTGGPNQFTTVEHLYNWQR